MAVRVVKRRFTVEEYHRMAQAGILTEDDRVELIEGEIIETAPIGSRHAACVNRLNRLFSQSVGDRAMISVQNPIRLGVHSEPHPDLALLKPRGDFYASAHPTAQDVLLVIEVAETSIDYDRQTRVPLYARAGVPEVWLVDLSGTRVEVYRLPREGRYSDVRIALQGETLTPQALPDVVVRVDEILSFRNG